MDCKETRARVQEALDGAPLPTQAKAHLAACAECRAFRARLSALDAALREDPSLAWTPALTTRVSEKIRRAGRWRAWLRVAAALLVAAAVWQSARLAAGIPPLREAASRFPAPVSGTGWLADARGALTALAARGASAFSDLAPGTGAAAAAAALGLLLVLNGAAILAPLAARRRSS